MKASLAIREILTKTCIIYTGMVLFLCLLLSGYQNMQISPVHFLLILPFSAFVALANFLHARTGWNAGLKFLVHLLLTVGGFVFFVYFPIYQGNSQSTSLLVILAFLILYLLCYGLIALFRSRYNKIKNEESAYTPQFSSKNNTPDTHSKRPSGNKK